jgi:diaminohydroxyphosphoribosylaminopyrimidine deaminase/5-amino-6-(5-phosphoribosylamino)uracil reductase
MRWRLKPGFGLGGRFDRTLNTEVLSSFDLRQEDEYWMEQALLVAMNGVGWAAPNPSVGCVIVKDKRIIAEGFTQAFRLEHAERMAFSQIDNLEHLRHATAYVTLEPCAHVGNQPPCVELFLESPIQRIVIACPDPDLRVNGVGIQKLKAAGKEVVVGVLQAEAQAWHFPFLKNRITQKPIWIAKWAENQDGYLADDQGNSKWITGSDSRAYTHWLRQKYDAILVGAATHLKDRPALTVRDCAEPHRRNPDRLVFDPKGLLCRLPKNDVLIHDQSPLYVYVEESNLVDPPKAEGLHWIPFNGISGFIQEVEKTNFNRPLQSVFCEGGARLLNSLMRHDIFDVVHQFRGKKIFNQTDPRYRVEFKPSESWFCAINHQFQHDDLHEWVKCF